MRAFRAFGGDSDLQVINVADEGATALLTLTEVASKAVPADAVPHNILEPQSEPGRLLTLVGNPVIAAGTPIVVRVDKAGGGPLTPGLYQMPAGLFVHAKTVLVDDQWAVIGSGNCMRRSLYTDLEHGVAFIDEDGTAVRDYRAALMADHFGHDTAADFNDVQAALNAWDPSWGTPGGAPPLPRKRLQRLALPVTEVAFTDARRKHYDMYDDADSRDDWGGLCP